MNLLDMKRKYNGLAVIIKPTKKQDQEMKKLHKEIIELQKIKGSRLDYEITTKKDPKMNYSSRILNNDLTIKELKPNTYFMLKAIDPDQVAKSSQVWIKESNSYCREAKRYIVSNCNDYNKEKLVKGSKKVFTGFTY
jgi:acid phosphatase class B